MMRGFGPALLHGDEEEGHFASSGGSGGHELLQARGVEPLRCHGGGMDPARSDAYTAATRFRGDEEEAGVQEDRAVNEGFRCSPLPALCPARLPARRPSVTDRMRVVATIEDPVVFRPTDDP
jgi:hypothetical protein